MELSVLVCVFACGRGRKAMAAEVVGRAGRPRNTYSSDAKVLLQLQRI